MQSPLTIRPPPIHALILHQHLQAIAACWKAFNWPPLTLSFLPPPPLVAHSQFFSNIDQIHSQNLHQSNILSFLSDPAVGAESGEVQYGSVQDALLPGQSAGWRAAEPKELASYRQPAHQKHPRTPRDFLCLLLPRVGEKPQGKHWEGTKEWMQNKEPEDQERMLVF